jgi:HEAT repeat protein
MKKMIAEYMEKGFLENIIDMFKNDRNLFPLIGDLMADERSRVRIGIVALVETLAQSYSTEIITAIPDIAKLLKNPNPTIRGDAAYLLGIIGHADALPFLKDAAIKENEEHIIQETIQDSIKQIERENSLKQ